MVNQRSKRVEGTRQIAVILCCSFILGSLLGTIWASGLEASQTEQLRRYIQDYLSSVESGGGTAAFRAVLWHHVRWYLCIVILGFSFLNNFFLPVLFGLRGFLLTFSTGCFLRTYGINGVLPGALLFGLPAALWIPAMWFAISAMVEFCRRQPASKPGDHQQGSRRDFSAAVGMSCALLILCVCLEYWLLPGLLPVAARMIN